MTFSITLVGWIVLLVVAGICGAIGQSIVGYSHAGCVGSVAIGFIGALLGAWLARLLRLPALVTLRVGGHGFPIVWAILGSALFVALLSLLSGGRWRARPA